MLSNGVSSTIFKVFGMTRPGIESKFPGPLANTLPTGPMSRLYSSIKTDFVYHPALGGEVILNIYIKLLDRLQTN